MPQVQAKNGLASLLAEVCLPESISAAPTRLGELWAERPVMLVHLRHFGCLFCRAHLIRLRDHHLQFTDHGVRVVAIGTGDIDYGRSLQEQIQFHFPLLLDEELKTYSAVEAGRGHLTDWALREVMRAAEKAARETGARHGLPGPHLGALGATHVIYPDGSVPFAWLNGDFSEDVPPEVVLNRVFARFRPAG
ncbi:MAG TPA: peroxiredoxin-like family protein [Myxococcaceae bacterium]